MIPPPTTMPRSDWGQDGRQGDPVRDQLVLEVDDRDDHERREEDEGGGQLPVEPEVDVGEGEEQRRSELHARIPPRDRRAAVPATPPEDHKAEDGHVVVPADGVRAGGAGRAGHPEASPIGEARGADVEEASHDSSQREGARHDHAFLSLYPVSHEVGRFQPPGPRDKEGRPVSGLPSVVWACGLSYGAVTAVLPLSPLVGVEEVQNVPTPPRPGHGTPAGMRSVYAPQPAGGVGTTLKNGPATWVPLLVTCTVRSVRVPVAAGKQVSPAAPG